MDGGHPRQERRPIRVVEMSDTGIGPCDGTLSAMADRTKLIPIQGGNAAQQVDLTELLEDMDLRQALPRLRALSRRRKPAANSVLAVVDAGTVEAPAPVPGEPDSGAPA